MSLPYTGIGINKLTMPGDILNDIGVFQHAPITEHRLYNTTRARGVLRTWQCPTA
jgi:hypothetical protein